MLRRSRRPRFARSSATWYERTSTSALSRVCSFVSSRGTQRRPEAGAGRDLRVGGGVFLCLSPWPPWPL